MIGYRDRAILEVLYATGIRKSELMNLTVADVNLEEGLLRVNGGKGTKTASSPLTRLACSFLENYIKAIRPEFWARPHNRLFLSLRGQPIGKNALGDLVEKYAKLARVKKHVTCHLWRHTCATHLVQEQGQPAPRPGNARPPLADHDRALPAPDHYRLEGGPPQVPSARTVRCEPVRKSAQSGL